MNSFRSIICKTDIKDNIKTGPQLRTKSDLTGKSLRWRASGQYNMIPETLRKTDKLPVFKNELKKWTWLNIPI
jgi:hypothetical protein